MLSRVTAKNVGDVFLRHSVETKKQTNNVHIWYQSRLTAIDSL